MDERNALKSKLLRTVGIDDTLRAWSQGMLDGKTLQQVTDALRSWLSRRFGCAKTERFHASPRSYRCHLRRFDGQSGMPYQAHRAG